jgi:short subunit dehydrogenase-like uncharacterized protein
MGCLDGCTTGEYKTVQYGDRTFDCQTIAETLGKHHTTAMAGRKQKWLRTICNRFDIQMIHGRMETKQQKGKKPSNKNLKTSWKTMNALYSDTRYSIKCVGWNPEQ